MIEPEIIESGKQITLQWHSLSPEQTKDISEDYEAWTHGREMREKSSND